MAEKEDLLLKSIEEIEAKEESILNDFRKRFNFLYWHNRSIIKINILIERYLRTKDHKIAATLAKIAFDIKKGLLENYAKLLEEVKEEESLISKEEREETALAALEQAEKKLYEKELPPAERAKKKILFEIKQKQDAIQGEVELRSYNDRLSQLLAAAEPIIQSQQAIARREIAILDSIIADPRAVTKSFSDELKEINEKLSVYLKEERSKFIEEIGALINIRKSISRRIEQLIYQKKGILNFLKGINKITIEDIKYDLRSLTKPEEINYYISKLKNYPNMLDKNALKYINDLEDIAHPKIGGIDSLTRLPGQSSYYQNIIKEMERSKRAKAPLAVVFIDIDYFKRINDSYGHNIGDIILKEVALAIRTSLRRHESVYRYGGEEFVIMLPETNKIQAEAFVNRMSSLIKSRIYEFPNLLTGALEKFNITISAGIAVYDGIESYSELTARADAAMYQAKQAGRDRVMAAA